MGKPAPGIDAANEITSREHLPECDVAIDRKEAMEDNFRPLWVDPPDDIECQCAKLRACEARVRREIGTEGSWW